MALKFLVITAFLVMGILLISGCVNEEKKDEHGLTIIENVELSEDEKAKLSSLIENIPEEVKQEFNIKYEAWKETLDEPNLRIHSNPAIPDMNINACSKDITFLCFRENYMQ